MHFLYNYGLYLAKAATIVIAILVILGFIMALATRSRQARMGKLSIRKINKQYEETIDCIREATHSKFELKLVKLTKKSEKKAKQKAQKKTDRSQKPRLFVLQFQGDLKASAVDALREMVTAILLAANPKQDHVLLKLESGGGMVHAYGLASSQLQRLREAKIKLTIAIDKIAASGGYMMACVADQVMAAPFAVIGSIGVIAQLPNFHRWLEKKNIDFEQLTAGEYKRTLTLFGENTSAGREKMRLELEEIHSLFKDFIKLYRPQVNIDEVATGEHWYATRAKNFQLVDHIQTSDDYLLKARDTFDMYQLDYKIKLPLNKRLIAATQNAWLHLNSQHSL